MHKKLIRLLVLLLSTSILYLCIGCTLQSSKPSVSCSLAAKYKGKEAIADKKFIKTLTVKINAGKIDKFSMVDIQAPDLGSSIFRERMKSCFTNNTEVRPGIEQEYTIEADIDTAGLNEQTLRDMLNSYPVKIVYLDKSGNKTSAAYHLGDFLKVNKQK